jgi:hypothetical protein
MNAVDSILQTILGDSPVGTRIFDKPFQALLRFSICNLGYAVSSIAERFGCQCKVWAKYYRLFSRKNIMENDPNAQTTLNLLGRISTGLGMGPTSKKCGAPSTMLHYVFKGGCRQK